jgi:hypothetical protein
LKSAAIAAGSHRVVALSNSGRKAAYVALLP